MSVHSTAQNLTFPQMARKTSLKDIAQAVGVSTALVSYVLNNQKENRIGKEVAKRIRQVAQELNYQPNQIAKSLKTNRTRTLGLVVADIANPYSSLMARIIEDEADTHDYTVIYGSSDENPQKCRKLLTTLLNRQVDGLLIAAPEGMESELAELKQRSIPFVLIDRYFPTLSTSYVALDNHQAMYIAAQHLIDLGYRRIGLVTYKTDLFHINERSRGFRSALTDNNIPVTRRQIKEVSNSTLAAGVVKALHDLTTGPQAVEAVVFASSTLAVYGLKYLKSSSLRVPDDIGLVSFDEADVNDLFYCPLTYVRQPLLEMGQLATRILLDLLASNNRITQTNLEATLVVQASTQRVSAMLPPAGPELRTPSAP